MSEVITDQKNIPPFIDLGKLESLVLGVMKPSSKVEVMPTKAPMPFLRSGKPANAFRQLKKAVIAGAGFDFMAVCADVMRTKGFNSPKIGVAYRSRHKCFSSDTEVLTNEGWKLFSDLTKNEKVMSWKDGKLEYQKPLAYQEYEIDEDVVGINTRSCDLLITQDHGMVVQEQDDPPKSQGNWKSDWSKVEAKDLRRYHRIPTAGNMDLPINTELPEQLSFIKDNNGLDNLTEYWWDFMGWYLSEGYAAGCSDGVPRTHSGRFNVGISQTKGQNLGWIKKTLTALKFNYWYADHEFIISNKQLWKAVFPCGNSYTKRMPRYLLEGGKKELEALWNSLTRGDGSEIEKQSGEIRRYYSVNKGLVDDVSELCVKLGISHSIAFKDGKIEHEIQGQKCTTKGGCWVLTTRLNDTHELRRGDNTPVINKTVSYKGKVYCVTTKAGAIIVRRNGKVVVAGNCGDAFDYDQASKSLVVVSEPHGLQQFFRTWLHCTKQDGSLGVNVTLKDIRGYTVKGWYFDFTAAAERLGWQRIPAWKGWTVKGVGYTKMEFWHYQCTEGLSFDEAMDFLYNDVSKVIVDSRKNPPERILGLNDRGSAVRNIQDKLSRILDKDKRPYLSRDEVDGVFGKVTQTAVKRLQEAYGLDSDGLVGSNTRALIERLV